MAERGKHRYSYVSAGSNTRIKTGAGSLYEVLVAPQNGASVLVVDALNLGATPDLNADPTGTISRFGVFASTAPVPILYGQGTGFDTGLVVAATSNARLTVVWE